MLFKLWIRYELLVGFEVVLVCGIVNKILIKSYII